MKKNSKVKVSAVANFLAEQSVPEENKFLWSYEIQIENNSDDIIQVLNRYWRITDMTGHVEEVRGPGVVGLQPIIKGAKQFSYNSYCQLMTPTGTMEGYYEMQNLDETRFIVEIPKFILSTPSELTALFRSRLH